MTLLVLDLLAGVVAGSACACGGAIKDAPYEGFKTRVFFRSPIIGACCGLLLGIVAQQGAIVAFLCAGYMERLVVEGWKLLRAKAPGKFQFGEWGVPKSTVLSSGRARA